MTLEEATALMKRLWRDGYVASIYGADGHCDVGVIGIREEARAAQPHQEEDGR